MEKISLFEISLEFLQKSKKKPLICCAIFNSIFFDMSSLPCRELWQFKYWALHQSFSAHFIQWIKFAAKISSSKSFIYDIFITAENFIHCI
jgi:hypothetical protein